MSFSEFETGRAMARTEHTHAVPDSFDLHRRRAGSSDRRAPNSWRKPSPVPDRGRPSLRPTRSPAKCRWLHSRLYRSFLRDSSYWSGDPRSARPRNERDRACWGDWDQSADVVMGSRFSAERSGRTLPCEERDQPLDSVSRSLSVCEPTRSVQTENLSPIARISNRERPRHRPAPESRCNLRSRTPYR